MAQNSSIEWTDATWNPVRGRTKVSPGCKHCYAERMALRLQLMGQPNYRQGFAVTLQEQMLALPLQGKKPRRVFVNSMGDLFREKVPDEFIRRVFAVMQEASWHTFQLPTKRAERPETLSQSLPWPANVWMGVSVETAVPVPPRPSAPRPGPGPIRLLRAAPGRPWDAQPRGDRLGHRGRRIGVGGATDGGGAGARHPRLMRRARGAVLLQAVGRHPQEAGRTPVGWSSVGRVASGHSLIAGSYGTYKD